MSRAKGVGIEIPYKAIIWIGDKPGQRATVFAKSLSEARMKLEDEYGKGHVISLWNEEAAERPR